LGRRWSRVLLEMIYRWSDGKDDFTCDCRLEPRDIGTRLTPPLRVLLARASNDHKREYVTIITGFVSRHETYDTDRLIQATWVKQEVKRTKERRTLVLNQLSEQSEQAE
jgi:hypothetical protein